MHTITQRLTAAACRILFLSALVVATSTAFAAEVPNYTIGDALKQAAPPPSPDRKEAPAPVTPVIIREEEKPLSLADGEKILSRISGSKALCKATRPNWRRLWPPTGTGSSPWRKLRR